jgi:hypothetical protein
VGSISYLQRALVKLNRIGGFKQMKVGSLVKIPEWQLKRHHWLDFSDRGLGVVLDVTPYSVHVRWNNGEELAHKTKTSKNFEVLA